MAPNEGNKAGHTLQASSVLPALRSMTGVHGNRPVGIGQTGEGSGLPGAELQRRQAGVNFLEQAASSWD